MTERRTFEIDIILGWNWQAQSFDGLGRGHARHLTMVKPGLNRFNPDRSHEETFLTRVLTRINSPLIRRWVKSLSRIILLLNGLNVSCDRYTGSDPD